MQSSNGADRPWLAEREVDQGRAVELVAASAPELVGRPVSSFGAGWDNTVYAVAGDPRWLFRFCRRRIAVAGIHREIAVLPLIASVLPRPVPVPVHVGDDGDPDEPWPFFGTPAVEGVELAVAGLVDRRRLAAGLGGFLRSLHHVDPGRVDVAELPVDPLRRGWPAARYDDTVDLLRRVASSAPWPGLPAATGLLASAARLGPPEEPPVLVHGDLHVRHVLVDARGGCAGVIDWGDVCLGHPAIDLAIGYAAFDGTARDAFVAAYGDGTDGIDVDTELRARALALRTSGFLAVQAADTDDRALLTEALAALDRAVR